MALSGCWPLSQLESCKDSIVEEGSLREELWVWMRSFGPCPCSSGVFHCAEWMRTLQRAEEFEWRQIGSCTSPISGRIGRG
jgi:hypothetical protein